MGAPSSKLIHWAENNPVVAAYGTAHELMQQLQYSENSHNNDDDDNDNDYSNNTPPNLEWDVFLDPALVSRVENVLAERTKFQRQQKELFSLSFSKKEAGDNDDDGMDPNSQKYQEQQKKEKQRYKHTMKFLDNELKKRAQVLVDNMLIAHGNVTQLALEQTGYLKRYIYSRVKRTRCTLGGGIFARQWMAVYAKALQLGVYNYNHDDDDHQNRDFDFAVHDYDYDYSYHDDDFDDYSGFNDEDPDANDDGKNSQRRRKKNSNNETRSNHHHHKTSLTALAQSKCPNTTISESVNILKSILKHKQPIGIILDIKSRHVSKEIWSLVIDTLRNCGVRVEGIGSFICNEVRDISSYCKTKPNYVNEIIFFHSAGDLQKACHNNEIQYGDKVFFNAGSLLWDGRREREGINSWYRDIALLLQSFDCNEMKRNYQILPFAQCSSNTTTSSTNTNNDITTATTTTPKETRKEQHRQEESEKEEQIRDQYDYTSTIESYKKRYNLSIGLYCQEFAIDDGAINCLVKLVNDNSSVYNLGLSWGGINGITINGIKPGKFTNTDGFWNQRYIATLWDYELSPPPPPEYRNRKLSEQK